MNGWRLWLMPGPFRRRRCIAAGTHRPQLVDLGRRKLLPQLLHLVKHMARDIRGDDVIELSDIEFTDRYDGIGRPHRWRYCRGQCEAVGVVPVKLGATEGEGDPELLRRAWAQHNEGGGHDPDGHDPDGTCDGWHFVTCPACEGSRLAPWPTALRRLPGLVARDARFVWREGIRQHTRPPHWTRRRQLALVLRVAARRAK